MDHSLIWKTNQPISISLVLVLFFKDNVQKKIRIPEEMYDTFLNVFSEQQYVVKSNNNELLIGYLVNPQITQISEQFL